MSRNAILILSVILVLGAGGIYYYMQPNTTDQSRELTLPEKARAINKQNADQNPIDEAGKKLQQRVEDTKGTDVDLTNPQNK